MNDLQRVADKIFLGFIGYSAYYELSNLVFGLLSIFLILLLSCKITYCSLATVFNFFNLSF